jgi:hypothetical protein
MHESTLNELMRKTETLTKADAAFNLIKGSMALHEELCDFIHARGRANLDLEIRNDSVPHVHEKHFESWLARASKVFETRVILALSRYPMLAHMDKHAEEKQEILSVLRGEVCSKLLEITRRSP